MTLLQEVEGVIRRRLLVNFRVDPDVVQKLLPPPFRPKLEADQAIAGICLIRLEAVRPKGFPEWFGLTSENAAHRVAVVWDEHGEPREGVYIPRRDTNSFFNRFAGGRLFPGEHEAARFDVQDDGDAVDLRMESNDGLVHVHVKGRTGNSLPSSSVFGSSAQASEFFETGSIGYSATRSGERLDAIALHTADWSVAPFDIDQVESSFFADVNVFPVGTASLDCALVMRDIQHSWRTEPPMCAVGDGR
jgi:hypothetical protein